MKLIFIFLAASFLGLPFGLTQNKNASTSLANPYTYRMKLAGKDSVLPIHFINATSLHHLPTVVQDLTVAFTESAFLKALLPAKKGFAVYLHDITCKSFGIAATVQ